MRLRARKGLMGDSFRQWVTEDFSEKVTFELTLNDPKEQAWEEGRRECYRHMEMPMQKPWGGTSLKFQNREKVDVGATNRNGRSVTRWPDSKGPSEARPVGCGENFGLYSQWLAHRRILSRGTTRSDGVLKSHCLPWESTLLWEKA